MENTLVMSFKNKEGKKVSIRVNKVKGDVQAKSVEEIMDSIVSKNLFTSKGGELKEKVSAELVGRTVQKLIG